MAVQHNDSPLHPMENNLLKHICLRGDASYKTFSEEFSQDRTSLIRYVESLFQAHYITKQQTIPGMEKSRLLFKPTQKGILYAIAHLHLDYDEVTKNHYKEEYDILIDVIPNKEDRDWWVRLFALHALQMNVFQKGKLHAATEREAMTLYTSILFELAQRGLINEKFLIYLIKSLGARYLPLLIQKMDEANKKIIDMIGVIREIKMKMQYEPKMLDIAN